MFVSCVLHVCVCVCVCVVWVLRVCLHVCACVCVTATWNKACPYSNLRPSNDLKIEICDIENTACNLVMTQQKAYFLGGGYFMTCKI